MIPKSRWINKVICCDNPGIHELTTTTNAAERIIRSPVVMRKISGGNKSGTETHEVLLSTIATYNLRGENFLEEGVKFMRDQLRQGIHVEKF
jgi:hypothetical protein